MDRAEDWCHYPQLYYNQMMIEPDDQGQMPGIYTTISFWRRVRVNGIF